MTLNHFFRRLHLYLALALLPWVLIYGIGAIPMAHPDLSDGLYDSNPDLWVTRFERPYDKVVPNDLSRPDMQVLGKQILQELGIEASGRSGAYRLRKNRLTAYAFDFWRYTRVTYEIDNGVIRVEDKNFRWMHFFSGLHQRGGFGHGSFMNDLWAVVVDVVALGFVLWCVSGLYMWWHLKQTRKWGFVALGSGFVAFCLFVVLL